MGQTGAISSVGIPTVVTPSTTFTTPSATTPPREVVLMTQATRSEQTPPGRLESGRVSSVTDRSRIPTLLKIAGWVALGLLAGTLLSLIPSTLRNESCPAPLAPRPLPPFATTGKDCPSIPDSMFIGQFLTTQSLVTTEGKTQKIWGYGAVANQPGDPLDAITLFAQPQSGIISIGHDDDSDIQIAYTPNEGFVGADCFIYGFKREPSTYWVKIDILVKPDGSVDITESPTFGDRIMTWKHDMYQLQADLDALHAIDPADNEKWKKWLALKEKFSLLETEFDSLNESGPLPSEILSLNEDLSEAIMSGMAKYANEEIVKLAHDIKG